jgi:serine/threonine-protein kinase RsbW
VSNRWLAHGHRRDTGARVEVRLPAEQAQLFVIRSLVTAVALRQDFDLDEVEDLKLAVDEMCSALVVRACVGELMVCTFDVEPGSVRVEASVGTDTAQPVERRTFGWQVLVTIADDVMTWVTPGHTSPHVVHVRMSKERRH